MRFIFTKFKIVIIIIIICIGSIFFFFLQNKESEIVVIPPNIQEIETYQSHKTIGSSVENRNIDVYSYGNGEKHLLFVGGIHGGYEWNSVLLAYKFIDYFEENKNIIPKNLTISIIPSLNPDGLYKVTGKEGRFNIEDIPTNEKILASGRFNANDVDLNRNFDCKWEKESMWRGNIISAGNKAFSEPESIAIRDFILENNPVSVIFWHSQSNAVYASECKNGILPETLKIMEKYAVAAEYPSIKSFDAYEITGDAEGWLASIGIPAITVELKTHETIEWEKNLSGVKALLEYYKQ